MQPIVLCHLILYDIEHYYMVGFLFYWHLLEKGVFIKSCCKWDQRNVICFWYCLKGQRKDGMKLNFLTYFFSRSWKRSHVKVPNYFFNSNALFYCVLLVHVDQLAFDLYFRCPGQLYPAESSFYGVDSMMNYSQLRLYSNFRLFYIHTQVKDEARNKIVSWDIGSIF